MSDPQNLVILFADICGSSPLYSESGNNEALQLIGARLDALAGIVAAHGGTVIRSKGDDVLCTFATANAALTAAREMVESSNQPRIQIRVGAHLGEAINARGDIFGDAVNLAARLLEIARPDEIIVSHTVAEDATGDAKSWLRFFSRQQLRGQPEPTELFSVQVPQTQETTAFTVVVPRQPRALANAVLRLEFQDQEWICAEGMTLTIGRSERCDVIVADPHVSREHASVTMRDGKATLTDRSSYGTWVGAETGEILLRRESTILFGKGIVSLGEKIADAGNMIIAYEQHRAN